MGIFEQMRKLTKGESIESNDNLNDKAEVGDLIQGVITNIIHTTDEKKGGFGFIASPALPYERIFFHWSGLRQDTLRFPVLEKKMRVEFILQYSERSEQHEGGYRAVKIRVL